MESFKYYMWILMVALTTCLTPIFIYNYIKTKAWYQLALALIINNIMLFGYFYIFKVHFIKAFTLAKILSFVGIILYGLFVLHEHIHIRSIIGLVLTFIAILLLG